MHRCDTQNISYTGVILVFNEIKLILVQRYYDRQHGWVISITLISSIQP
jgi:hypothetical protein